MKEKAKAYIEELIKGLEHPGSCITHKLEIRNILLREKENAKMKKWQEVEYKANKILEEWPEERIWGEADPNENTGGFI